MTEKAKVLIVEDDRDWLEIYALELQNKEYEIFTARSFVQTEKLLNQTDFDVVATDLRLLGSNDSGGMDVLQLVRRKSHTTQVIIFTAYGGTEDAIRAQRQGAFDYLVKPLNYSRAQIVIRAAIAQRKALLEGQTKLERELPPFPERFIARSEIMRQVVNEVAHQAELTSPVIIIGPRGTGKGLLAEGIHFGSKRNPLYIVDCTSVSESTLDQILFGRTDKGDHISTNPGFLLSLSNGTLILDRISGMSHRLQKKLLDFMRNAEDLSADGQHIVSHARLICLDTINLAERVKLGLFSPDLYAELAISVIVVPPLHARHDTNERYNDILPLAQYFIEKFSESVNRPTLSIEAEDFLLQYSFPENVWELQEAIRYALTVTTEDKIELRHLPYSIINAGSSRGLGREQDRQTIPVLCPHGTFLCNQVKLILSKYSTQKGIYIRLTPNTAENIAEVISSLIQLHKLAVNTLQDSDHYIHGQCKTCVPIQSSYLAIVDVTNGDKQCWYEVGMLYSLGIPTFLFTNASDTHKHPGFDVFSYHHIDELLTHMKAWLEKFVRTLEVIE